MFRKMTLALLAGASALLPDPSAAAAIEAALPEPTGDLRQSGCAPPAPVRTASATLQLGGGFIEFLFGDGQAQGGRYPQQPPYQQQPVYQQQPAYDGRRRCCCR